MPKYQVKTDQGTFEIEVAESEPSKPNRASPPPLGFSGALRESSPFSATRLDLSKPNTGIPVLDKSRTEQLQDVGRSFWPGQGQYKEGDPLGYVHHIPLIGPGLAQVGADIGGDKLSEAAGHLVGTMAVPTGTTKSIGLQSPVTIADVPAIKMPSLVKRYAHGTPHLIEDVSRLRFRSPIVDTRPVPQTNTIPPVSPSAPPGSVNPTPAPWEQPGFEPRMTPFKAAPPPPQPAIEPMTLPPTPPAAPFGSVKPNPAPWENQAFPSVANTGQRAPAPPQPTPVKRPLIPRVESQPAAMSDISPIAPEGGKLPSGRTPGAPDPFVGPMRPIEPVASSATNAQASAPTTRSVKHPPSHTDVNRQLHANAADLELPGSPAGKNGHAAISKAAKKVFGVDSTADLTYEQSFILNEFLLQNKRLPTSVMDLKSGLK